DHVGSAWWADDTSSAYPDWIQVEFAGSKTIGEIDIFGLQQNPSNPVEPTSTMTSSYALTDFEVQYWTGSTWTTVPGGTITGNDKVWRKLTFAPLTTSKIRVHVTNVAGDNRSQVVEIEAYAPANEAVFQWLIPDHLGTPRMIIDRTGTLANIKRHDYLPFGEELFAPSGGRTTALGYSSGDGIRQQFTSKERDVETGLDYFAARYYSSVLGRFTSPDKPFADQFQANPQSWNVYSYVRNSPCNNVDIKGRCSAPAGLKPGQVGICIEAFIASSRPTKYGQSGLGDSRGFSGDDPSLTSRVRVDVIAGRSAETPKNFAIVQKTTAGMTVADNPVAGIVPNTPPLLIAQGSADTKLNGRSQRSDGSSGVLSPIQSDGTVNFTIATTARNGVDTLAGINIMGEIKIQLNLSVNTNTGQVGIAEGSSATAYPSIAVYSYVYEGDKIVSQEIWKRSEASPSDLDNPMQPIPEVTPR
ncbi:MAG TPA: RHS repeat-associated core domain-containing protein, partial [Pyrinomonadaceae bacterium]